MLTDKERQIARNSVAGILKELGYKETAILVTEGFRDKTPMMQQAMQLLATIKQHVS